MSFKSEASASAEEDALVQNGTVSLMPFVVERRDEQSLRLSAAIEDAISSPTLQKFFLFAVKRSKIARLEWRIAYGGFSYFGGFYTL